jgi:IMP dehydrogenase/GMP reductase
MNKGVKSHIEGKDYLIDPRGPLINTINNYEDSLRSSISYSGYNTIDNMRGNCDFIEIVK